MAGLYFGKSRWDEIPPALGLTVDDGGMMSGLWQGTHVDAHFYNQEDARGTVSHHTDVGMPFDPPLGVQGLERAELWTRIVDPQLCADFEARAKGLGMFAAFIGDGGIRGSWPHYESGVERYRAAFELFRVMEQPVWFSEPEGRPDRAARAPRTNASANRSSSAHHGRPFQRQRNSYDSFDIAPAFVED